MYKTVTALTEDPEMKNFVGNDGYKIVKEDEIKGYVASLKEEKAEIVTAKRILNPQESTQQFVRMSQDIAIGFPLEDGPLAMQVVKEGGYLNITDMDNIYSLSKNAFEQKYDRIVHVNGKEYRTIPDNEMYRYIYELEKCNAQQVDAEKSGCLLVRPAVEGEEIHVWTETGTEAVEIGKEGMYVTMAVDPNGSPILNAAGKLNIWQQGEENLYKKYDMENSQSLFVKHRFMKPKGGIQHFVQVNENIAIMQPWGENGAMVPQTIDAGGYLNVSDMDDVYGIGEAEFKKTYTVETTIQNKREDLGLMLFALNKEIKDFCDMTCFTQTDAEAINFFYTQIIENGQTFRETYDAWYLDTNGQAMTKNDLDNAVKATQNSFNHTQDIQREYEKTNLGEAFLKGKVSLEDIKNEIRKEGTSEKPVNPGSDWNPAGGR